MLHAPYLPHIFLAHGPLGTLRCMREATTEKSPYASGAHRVVDNDLCWGEHAIAVEVESSSIVQDCDASPSDGQLH